MAYWDFCFHFPRGTIVIVKQGTGGGCAQSGGICSGLADELEQVGYLLTPDQQMDRPSLPGRSLDEAACFER